MDVSKFQWLNESTLTFEGDSFTIYAPPECDFFNNPVPENGEFIKPLGNAPFLFTEVEGDFVIRVKVTPCFVSDYDAACIMVIQDENVWLKAAFEKSDFGTTTIVCVVTNKVSDDANGCNVDSDTVWLQVARRGNNFAVHYSLDGLRFDMVRLCLLPVGAVLKVGIEAQSPTGKGGIHRFSNLTIQKQTVADLRAGV